MTDPLDTVDVLSGGERSRPPAFIRDDPREAAKVNRAANHSALFGIPEVEAYDYSDAIREVVEERKKAQATAGKPERYDPLLTFDSDALAGVDPFTGTTARDNAEILYPLARPWLRLGYTAAGALNESVRHITDRVKKIADFAAQSLGQFGDAPASWVPPLSEWAKKYQQNADYWKGKARAAGEGAGEAENLFVEFFGEVGGSFVPGIAEFLAGGKVPAIAYHGAAGAAEASEQGKDPFLGFMRGAMERGVMGELLHGMSVLSRPLRATGTGIVFEEQSRLSPRPKGQEAKPEDNLKAGATGFLFGLMGGKGKFGVREIGDELINLETEFAAKAREMDVRGAGVVGSEAGAVGKDISKKEGEKEQETGQEKKEGERAGEEPPADEIVESMANAESGNDKTDTMTPERRQKLLSGEEAVSFEDAQRILSELPQEPFEATAESVQSGTLTPEAQALHDTVEKSLTQSTKINIKNQIRQETGQIKAGDVLEMKEIDLLNLQMRTASRAARQAFGTGKKEGEDRGIMRGLVYGAKEGFREGKKEGTEAGLNAGILKGLVAGARAGVEEGKRVAAEHFMLMKERAEQRAAARKELKDIVSDLKEVVKSVDKMTPFNSDNVKRVMDGLDLAKLSARKRLDLEATRDWLARNPDTELPDHVLDDLTRLNKTPVRDLTVDEIRSLHKAVMHYAKQSEMVNSLRIGKEKRDFQKAKSDSIKEMKEPGQAEEEILFADPSLWDKFSEAGDWLKKTFGIRQDSFDLIVEKLAGMNSTMHTVLFKNIHEGRQTQLRYVQGAQKAFREGLEKAGFFDKVKNVDKWLGEREGKFNLTRNQRMSLYRHSLNEDNRAAILEGGFGIKVPNPKSGVTPNTVIRITEADLDGILKGLTPEEKMFADQCGPLFEAQHKALNDTFTSLNGYRLDKQENYFPKDVMPLQRGGLDFESEEGLEAFRQFTTRVGIDKAMLISRQGSKKPIYLNDLTHEVTRSVERAGAYVGLEEPMRNASKLLYDIDFKREIVDRYGRDTWAEIEKGLKDVAGSYREITVTEKGLMKLKTQAVKSILSMNPWIWANQPFSLPIYNVYVESKYLVKGLVDSVLHPKETLDRHRMYSPELIDRIEGGYDRDVAAAFKQTADKAFYNGKDGIPEKLLVPTKWFDLTAVVPGMQGAYYKAMAEFRRGKMSETVSKALGLTDSEVAKMTPEEKVVQAYRFADWTTERTQAQSTPEFRSSLTRGTPFEQMVTAFGSQTNAMLNLVRRTWDDYQKTGSRESLHSAGKALFQVFIFNAAMMYGIDKTRDALYGREGKGVIQGLIDNATGMMFVVRDIGKLVTATLEEGSRAPDAKVPIQKYFDVLKRITVNVHDIVTNPNQAKVEEAWMDFMENHIVLLSLYTGLPYETPKRFGMAIAGENPKPKKKERGVFDVIEDDLDEVFE